MSPKESSRAGDLDELKRFLNETKKLKKSIIINIINRMIDKIEKKLLSIDNDTGRKELEKVKIYKLKFREGEQTTLDIFRDSKE